MTYIKTHKDYLHLLDTPREVESKEKILAMVELASLGDYTEIKNVGGKDEGFLWMYYDEQNGVVGWKRLGLTFYKINGGIFMWLHSPSCDLKITGNTKSLFIFEDGDLLQLKGDRIYMTPELISTFKEKPLDGWVIDGIDCDLTLFAKTSDIPDKETVQELIKKIVTLISTT